jgi:hypothetical protein
MGWAEPSHDVLFGLQKHVPRQQQVAEQLDDLESVSTILGTDHVLDLPTKRDQGASTYIRWEGVSHLDAGHLFFAINEALSDFLGVNLGLIGLFGLGLLDPRDCTLQVRFAAYSNPEEI